MLVPDNNEKKTKQILGDMSRWKPKQILGGMLGYYKNQSWGLNGVLRVSTKWSLV